jgi:hypothetical protein
MNANAKRGKRQTTKSTRGAPKQPEPGSLASLMRGVHGGAGFRLWFKATVVCDSPVKANGRACCSSDTFEAAFLGSGVDVFDEAAQKYFKSRGWLISWDGKSVKCPECRGRQ